VKHDHMRHRNVSNGTYNAGCRCDGCTEAHRVSALRGSARAHRAAAWQASKWVRENHPDVWDEIVDAVYAEAGEARRPVGRPRKAVS
jgi:hypothetical protein